ncbi:MAG: HIT domain-containing protein [Acidimicrobiia bacterium]|nr:HIT domain-containing protein [Acidimicrobiia bacterium]
MATIFTRIIEGEIPGTFVWKDDRCVSFLSVNPLNRGHALVVPRVEVDHWLDADGDVRQHLFEVAHTIGRAQFAAFDVERIGVIIAGMEVPHLHIHVVPVNSESQLSFANAATDVDREDLEAAAEDIRRHLEAAGETGVAR